MVVVESVGGRPLDDRELVEKAKAGDVDAYAVLVERYQAVAHRVAFLIAGGSGDAEDAVQEAMVKAFYALGRFRAEAEFRPWILKIVANEAKNRRRRAKRQADLALRVGEERASGDAAPSPEVAALEEERRTGLLRAVNRLKEKDRTVVVLRYFMEMSEAETAEILGVAVGTVKSRLSRALGRLKAALEEPEYASPIARERS
ncbi:MAG: RNA polymerase sigma factor [Actinomycetota bacterium]|nr:RNA polymerase sigma factor [Actinomycetota bacterium]